DQIGWIESPAIDLTNYPEVSLRFQQAYRHCCANGFLFRVQFSDNNFTTTPTTYTVNVPGISANQFTGTDTRLVNIKSFLQTATDLTNVKMRFLFDGTGGTSHYFWSVDDVALIETYENNINLLTREIGYGQFQYPAHIFPQHQLTEVTFSGRVRNDGLVANNNVRLEVNVSNNGAPVGTVTSPGTVLNAGIVDSLVTTSWLPTGNPGTEYDLTFMTAQDETDEFIINTVREDVLRITDTVFGVDNFTISGAFTNFSSQPGQAVKIGNVMEIIENTWATSISIYIMNRPDNVGQLVFGELRAWDDVAGDFIYLTETDPLEVANNQLGSFVTINFIEPVFLEAGTEILLLAGHFGSGNSTDPDMAIGMSRAVRGGLVFGYTADNNLVQLLEPRSILTRLNLVFDLSSEDIVAKNVLVSNAYPNPTIQTTSVDITLNNATELSYKVVDMAGKVMVQSNEGLLSAGGHQITIDASTFASGMYYLNIQTAEGTTTKKIIVSK
ncbi:MAG: T9SS type A sorting domain-containing protein, partial [Crocinitomicaceae bacterium]|nr:T9SS type A sorting domain-containing protein [Crocinitomicaceae bacterium]